MFKDVSWAKQRLVVQVNSLMPRVLKWTREPFLGSCFQTKFRHKTLNQGIKKKKKNQEGNRSQTDLDGGVRGQCAPSAE